MTDWYLTNLHVLVATFAVSLGAFLLLFIVLSVRVRRQFIGAAGESRKSSDTPEVALIKVHTRAVRSLSLIGLLLQIFLLARVTKLSTESTSYSLSIVRPVLNLCVLILGFMTNTHAAFRIAYLLFLGQLLVVDTIAEVSLAMVINCLQREGLQCGDSALSVPISELQRLQWRELASLFLTPWIALETAYLCVAIGFCSSRYTKRQLSLSRPMFNLRAALVAQFPPPAASPRPAATDKPPRFVV